MLDSPRAAFVARVASRVATLAIAAIVTVRSPIGLLRIVGVVVLLSTAVQLGRMFEHRRPR